MKGILSKLSSSKLIRRIIICSGAIELVCALITGLACYFILWPELKSTAIQNASNTASEIGSQIDDYISTLTSASQFIASSNELKDSLSQYRTDPTDQNYNLIRLTLDELCSNMTNIRCVIVTSPDGNDFSSIMGVTEQDLEIVERYRDSSASRKFSEIYTVGSAPETNVLCYMYTRNIQNVTYKFHFFYKVNTIVNTITNLSENSFDGFALCDSSSNIFYSSGLVSTLEQYVGNYGSTSLDSVNSDESGYYFTESTNSFYWHFIAYASNSTISASVISFMYLCSLFFIAFFVLSLLAIIIIIYHFITPINQLNNTMQAVSEGDLTVISNIKTGDEIESLSAIFNTMLESIRKYIDSRIEYENREQRMNYNLLIAQIDSHFICNTLITINTMARKNMNAEIVEANTALTRIVQNCLRVKTYTITDTIEQEINILEQYLIIERLRYRNKAQIIIDVPEELFQYEIPKNIIQPVVENSLLHGLMNLDTGEIDGIITLVIYLQAGHIIVEITDNGKGVDNQKLEMLNSISDFVELTKERGKHIGLTNIHRRLHHIYKGEAKMTFSNSNGFSVTFSLPIIDDNFR